MFFGLNDVGFLAAVSAPALDPDAAAYIAAVEAAGTQALEPAVRAAINDFVVGCKADGIWNAIKASCILAGARTLNGCLTPLVGAAPTSFNFVADDYDRKTGLVGDGSTKYLDSNRNNNADPQNSKHLALFYSSRGQGVDFVQHMGSANATGSSAIRGQGGQPENCVTRVNSSLDLITSSAFPEMNNFAGTSRSSSSQYNLRSNKSNHAITSLSEIPSSGVISVFRRGTDGFYSNARLSFYSIGESLDLALLDARVTALINAFDAAI